MRRVFNLELLLPVLVIIAIGLTTLFTLDRNLFQNQLIFVLVGFLAFIVFSSLDYRAFKSFMVPIFIISVVLLFLLLLVGVEARGAVRWLDIAAPFRIQISEILKPFLILSLSAFLTKKGEKTSFLGFFLILSLLGLVVLPIFLQPDLGNVLIYLLTALFLLIFYGISFLWLAIPGAIFSIFLPLLWQFFREYQKQRIVSFLNPGGDPLGSSYNLIQSVIAVGGGEFFGRGLGHGTQSLLRFLPERHTDFIFATISENFGFLGASLLLGAFIFLLARIYKGIKETEDTFGRLFLAGAFILVLIQVFINIGGNIGVIPITGVTLPLVSYGGSSILSTSILLGIVNSILIGESKSRTTLEIH